MPLVVLQERKDIIMQGESAEKYTLEYLEKRIGYTFRNKVLLQQALTHSSYANERRVNKVDDYERMEFLGDAVLELITSEFLFGEHPEMSEGELTKTRAAIVCEPSLALCARDLELGKYIRLGKGEEMTGGRNRDSIISDVLEAVIGAIYLDSGFEEAKKFIGLFILSDLENKVLFYDAKTILQEKLQRKGQDVQYVLVEETGPEHDKIFSVEVRFGDKVLGRGSGHNKKAAEQQAAYEALLAEK